MAFTRKPSPIQLVSITGQIPTPPPKIPKDMLQRFPSWVQYDEDFQAWWGKFSDLLQRDRSSIQSQFLVDEAAAKSSITSIQSSLATITSQLAAITPGSGLASQVAALVAQLTAVVAGLASHIASTQTHGTISDVVGETDVQNLDNKTIGSAFPGYGRFVLGALGFNQLGPGETLNVTENDFLITAGPVDISGSLIVDGVLLAE